MVLNTLCVFGTRPEAIKMAPVIRQLERNILFSNKICVTGQHKEMLDPVLDLFDLRPDFNLEVMEPNQDLCHLTASILEKINGVFKQYKPDVVLVHGDTTTAFVATLASYYHQIPVVHIEAGLRTGNLYSPWPEEVNRKLIGGMAALHFAPSQQARLNLLGEGVADHTIFVTGNTVIDALLEINDKIEMNPTLQVMLSKTYPFISNDRLMILVTCHRRENFGAGFQRVCQALMDIAQKFPMIDIVYPVHLNPNIYQKIHSMLGGIKNIHLILPVNYLQFVYLMRKAYFILTDSGGIQEEAPSLGKPVLVMRDTTERPEAIAVGTAKLVGTETKRILSEVNDLLTNVTSYQQMSGAKNPYGDGRASQGIVNIMMKHYKLKENLQTTADEPAFI